MHITYFQRSYALILKGQKIDNWHSSKFVELTLNYFEGRLTNSSAESFNAKIKALRSQFRGVGDVKFFMYRLAKLYS